MDPKQINIVVPFAGNLGVVERELDQSWGNVAKEPIKTFLDELAVVHFMGIHALPGEPKNHLVFELTLDGSADYVIARLAKDLGVQLAALFSAAGLAFSDIEQFLRRHIVPVGIGWTQVCGLGFIGTPGFTVRRILAEDALTKWLGEQLLALPPDASAADKLKTVRDRLWREQSLKWAFEEDPMLADKGSLSDLEAVRESILPALRELLWPLLIAPAFAFGVGMLGGPLPAVGLSSLTGLAEGGLLAALYDRFRKAEQTDEEDTELPDLAALAECTGREDQAAQNHLIVLSNLKPGALRRLTLKIAFFMIRQAATHVFAPGKLADIATIHSARWIVLPGTSQLAFFSNYGGSWDSYLEDFIIKAHEGLTGVWSNTMGYPRAKNLFYDGATNGSQFKTWARRQQQPTRFWYSAYPKLTTGRIRTNAAIRQALAEPQHLSQAAAQRAAESFLALFGAPRPAAASTLDAERLPALVFGGLPRSKHGKALLLRFRDGAEARNFTARVERHVSFGEHASRTRVFALAFSARGLSKMGLDVSTFPIAFREDSVARARKLGDRTADMRWGGKQETVVDAIALLYGADAEELTQLEHDVAAGEHVCQVIEFQPNVGGQMREPFGFVDGVSQPIMRSTSQLEPMRRVDQLIAPGEIVLGHPDDSSFTPRTASVHRQDDPQDLLPKAHHDEDLRDLGLDGSFLVVRQLRQKVTEFEDYLRTAADDLHVQAAKKGDAATRREWVAAKLMGRWRNGTSLVRNPDAPGPDIAPDNDFRYGIEDPDGVACPFGAHIRRANPRDSFDASVAEPLKITNRHRILRIGRVYRGPNEEQGMMFMCLNADIERQFEFIQQTWLASPSFHGLNNEVDAMAMAVANVDRNQNVMTVPTPRGPLQLRGLSEFVQVVGSGYFFMPGRRCLAFLASRAQAPSQAVAAE
ncbi:MAG TPA: hypothetical protein VFN67_27655 [Polyangiales bacterium]|nr:hypothetical protein [Polyangiales bacterium]